MNPNSLNNQPQIPGISPDTGDYEIFNQNQNTETEKLNYQEELNSIQNPHLQSHSSLDVNPNEKLIFWLKFEGVISYISFGFCILLGLLSILSIVGIFTTLPLIVLAGIYSLNRAKQHYKIMNKLKSGGDQSSILEDLKQIYKWSGIVNIISIVGAIGIVITSFLSFIYLINNFNFSEGGNNSKSIPSICDKAPYSIDCTNAIKSKSSTSTPSY